MRTVERWWNGSYGRLNRRWLWLLTDGETWRVEAREGDNDAKTWQSKNFPSELDARLLLRTMKERTGDTWRDMTPG